MMVLQRPRGLGLFFALRGSVVPQIAPNIVACTVLAVVVTYAHGFLFHWKVTLTPVPFSLMGLALAIFLGFRNSAAYERYWEARKLWGDLVHRARSLARQLQTLTNVPEAAKFSDRQDLRTVMILRTIAFVHALRHQLRGTAADRDIAPWIAEEELPAFSNARAGANHLLTRNGRDLGACLRSGHIDPRIAAEIDATLSALGAAAAGCERIKSTPIPFAYTLLLHRTAYLYCFLLPFGLVDLIGITTPIVVAIIAYTFFGLDAVGNEIEEPFGLLSHHLPLDAICRTIEIDLLEALDASEVPLPLQPIDGWLH